jgi:hypothetical protein
MDVLEDLTQLIESLLAALIAALALAWTIIAYWLNKRNALALERTKFIFENLRFFETDPLMQMANQIVNGLVADFTIDAFLNVRKAGDGTPEQITKCMALDNYLNFLWRIAYAHFTLKTVTTDDLDGFGYYFYLISQHEGLMRYCVCEGFEEIIDAIEKLKPIWDETEIENDYRRKLITKWVADKTAAGKAP